MEFFKPLMRKNGMIFDLFAAQVVSAAAGAGGAAGAAPRHAGAAGCPRLWRRQGMSHFNHFPSFSRCI